MADYATVRDLAADVLSVRLKIVRCPEITSDGQDHRVATLIEALSDQFALTEDERDQRISTIGDISVW